ncbi:MAG: winged helix-turn-helix domain-containing protein [Candidatus Bathyarchaeia archaeon]
MVKNPIDSRRRRGRLSIMAEFLDVAREGVLKTRIMYQANLSFAQLNDYLTLLIDWNLLEAVKTSDRTIYKTTEKGLRFLQSYREIMELLAKGKENNLNDANSLHLIKRGTKVILL